LEDTGSLAEIPENLRNYFDFQAYARDARLGGDVVFVRHEGEVWVFWNH
jgi:antirestriction protein